MLQLNAMNADPCAAYTSIVEHVEQILCETLPEPFSYTPVICSLLALGCGFLAVPRYLKCNVLRKDWNVASISHRHAIRFALLICSPVALFFVVNLSSYIDDG